MMMMRRRRRRNMRKRRNRRKRIKGRGKDKVGEKEDGGGMIDQLYLEISNSETTQKQSNLINLSVYIQSYRRKLKI